MNGPVQGRAASAPARSAGRLGLELRARAQAGEFALTLELAVEQGPVALVGPNGAGKTSVLRLLAGGLAPLSGRARVGGRVLFDLDAGQLLPPERRGVGYLPQDGGLFPHLSALDNVAFGVPDPSLGERRARALQALQRFSVEALADRRPGALSGGERQRVGLARALAAEPALLLLDEPTSALDIGARAEARELLQEVFRDLDGHAIIVTHDLRDLLAWRPTLALMEAGRVAAVGSLEQLKGAGHPFLDELLSPIA